MSFSFLKRTYSYPEVNGIQYNRFKNGFKFRILGQILEQSRHILRCINHLEYLTWSKNAASELLQCSELSKDNFSFCMLKNQLLDNSPFHASTCKYATLPFLCYHLQSYRYLFHSTDLNFNETYRKYILYSSFSNHLYFLTLLLSGGVLDHKGIQ